MQWIRAQIFRSGETVSHWNHETDDVTVSPKSEYPGNSGVQLRFKIASKGGGVTDVALIVNEEAFDYFLQAMWETSPDMMAKLMARQLNKHFSG
jgi:hypothetical protein